MCLKVLSQRSFKKLVYILLTTHSDKGERKQCSLFGGYFAAWSKISGFLPRKKKRTDIGRQPQYTTEKKIRILEGDIHLYFQIHSQGQYAFIP